MKNGYSFGLHNHGHGNGVELYKWPWYSTVKYLFLTPHLSLCHLEVGSSRRAWQKHLLPGTLARASRVYSLSMNLSLRYNRSQEDQ